MKFGTPIRLGAFLAVLICACPIWSYEPPTQAAAADFAAGVGYLRQGNLRAAEEKLLKAAQMDPSNPQSYNLLGFIADQTGRPAQGVRYYRKSLQLDPNFTAARNNLGSLFLRQGKLDLARREFEKTLESDANNVTAHNNLGLVAFEQGQYDRAVFQLEKARNAAPHDLGVLFTLAQAYYAAGRRSEGLKAAIQVAAGAGNNPAIFFNVGTLLMQEREYGQAATCLTKANELVPHEPEILLHLAQAYFSLKRGQKALGAIEEFIEALKMHPEEESSAAASLPVAWNILYHLRDGNSASYPIGYALAEVLFLERKYKDTLEVLKTVAPEQGTAAAPYFNLLGLSYAGLDQYQDAAQALIRAIQLAPAGSDLYFNLASIYQKAGDNRNAVKILQQTLGRDSNSATAFFSLGLSQFNLGSYADAAQSFERSITLRPDFVQARLFLGRAYEKLGNLPEAAASYRKAIASQPVYSPAYFQLAQLLLHSGDTKQAFPLLEEVTRLNPRDAEAHYELGKIYAAQGDVSKAIGELERALAINPRKDAPYYQLARLYEGIGNTKKARELFKIVNTRKAEQLRKYQKVLSAPQ